MKSIWFTTLVVGMVCVLPLGAEAKKITPHAAEPTKVSFLSTYLQCKKSNLSATPSDLEKLSCEERVSVHFCAMLQKAPEDVQNSLSLEVYCNVLAEQHGGNAAQDAEVISTANEAGCYQGGDVRAALLEKYKSNDEVIDTLQNFTKSLLANEETCFNPIKPDAQPVTALPEETH